MGDVVAVAHVGDPQAVERLAGTLIDSGALVICAGGGGIPVALNGNGTMRGVEAVVDKDLTAALLGRRLEADLLVMLTDVDGVHLDWGGEADRRIDAIGNAVEIVRGEAGTQVAVRG